MTTTTDEARLSRSRRTAQWIRANRVRVSVFAVLAFLFLAALQGLDTEDWFITVMRGLSVGAITFLVASGLSLIFGLMDVLNLAHGELFMIGAYVGWTAYVRPDTVVDVLVPLLFLASPFLLMPLWRRLARRVPAGIRARRVLGWVVIGAGVAIAVIMVTRFPLVIWDPEVYAESPITYSLAVANCRSPSWGGCTVS